MKNIYYLILIPAFLLITSCGKDGKVGPADAIGISGGKVGPTGISAAGSAGAKGATGNAGAVGAVGVAGNSDVRVYAKHIDGDTWTTINHATDSAYSELDIPASNTLADSVIKNSTILVYVKHLIIDTTGIAKYAWFATPFAETEMLVYSLPYRRRNGLMTTNVTTNVTPGHVLLKFRAVDDLGSHFIIGIHNITDVKLVIIPNAGPDQNLAAKYPNVNFKNLAEVENHFHLKDAGGGVEVPAKILK